MTFSRLWTFLAVALPTLAGLLASMSTVDLAYHLRAGGELLDSGAIATHDTYTHTAAGAAWLNQQWAAQAILAAVYRVAGWEGLVILRAAAIGATFGLVLLACRLRGATPRTAALLTIAAFALSAAALGLRPQLFGMLAFGVLLVIVAARRTHPRLLWAAPILALAWANLHGSFFIAPLCLGVAWLEGRHDRDPRARQTLAVAVVSALAACITPFGPGVWLYAAGLSTNPEVTSRISEWQPTTLRTTLGIAFYLSAVAVVALLARRARSTPWPTLLWLGALFAIGAYALRGVAWWPLGAVVVVAGLLDRPAQMRVERPVRLNVAVAALLVAAGVALLPWWRVPDPLAGRAGVLLEAPSSLTATLRDLVRPGDRLFQPQAWGSWFELTVPALPTFVDSRIELFDPAVWREYAAVTEAIDGWPDILDRRGVTIVVTDDGTESVGDRLAKDPGWRRVYADTEGRIFVRADRPGG